MARSSACRPSESRVLIVRTAQPVATLRLLSVCLLPAVLRVLQYSSDSAGQRVRVVRWRHAAARHLQGVLAHAEPCEYPGVPQGCARSAMRAIGSARSYRGYWLQWCRCSVQHAAHTTQRQPLQEGFTACTCAAGSAAAAACCRHSFPQRRPACAVVTVASVGNCGG